MPPNHARSGVTHHGFDLVATRALVTMDGTTGAGRLLRSKPTPLQARARVIQELPALRTRRRSVVVVTEAVKLDHGGHGFPFPTQPAIFEARGKNFRRC